MIEEVMLGDVYEEIAERLAQSRTKALMGEREEALGLLQSAILELKRFRDLLSGYPGFLALEHSMHMTLGALCAQQAETDPQTVASKRPMRATRSRHNADRAA